MSTVKRSRNRKHFLKSSLLGGVTIAVLSFTSIALAQAQVTNGDLTIENKKLQLGQTQIDVIVYKNTNPGRHLNATFISLHNNEQLGNTALLSRIITDGGKLVALMPQRDERGNLCRFLKFQVNGQNAYVDPNRIWVNEKITILRSVDCSTNDQTVENNQQQARDAKNTVINFRNNLLQVIGFSPNSPPSNSYLIGFHNNRNLSFNSSVLIPLPECK